MALPMLTNIELLVSPGHPARSARHHGRGRCSAVRSADLEGKLPWTLIFFDVS